MNIIDTIRSRAKINKKRIILPESMDIRVLEAASKIIKEEIADIILIGNLDNIKKTKEDLDLSKIEIIDPYTSNYTNILIEKLYELRKNKGLSKEEAKELLLNDNMYYACMLVHENHADGVVSGACHSTANTLKPALQIIKAKKEIKLVSAFFLMEVPDCKYGSKGTFIFADSGLVQNPTSEELAIIAGTSAESFRLLVEDKPIIAMLSHSTKGSAEHEDITKVREATKLAQELYPEYIIDGELQLDAAIVPEIAKEKAPQSNVKGEANVLIFPNLDAGNIGYKLVQRLAKAKAYGPICQGLNKPINDLSRGCTSDDIVGVVAITAIQANN